MTPQEQVNLIPFTIAFAFVLFSVPEQLSKLGWAWDEFKLNGTGSAVILLTKMVWSCLKCCTFYCAIAITGSFTIAGCLAFLMYLLNRHN